MRDLNSARAAVELARSILRGETALIPGSRRLAALAHDLVPDWRVDDDFVVFAALASRPPCLSVFAATLLLASPPTVWADKARDVAALEAKCEQERQAKIKPLREAQIAKCKADTRNDPEHCEHFWSDYGNGGRRTPRLFDSLPSCVAAAKARKALHSDED